MPDWLVAATHLLIRAAKTELDWLSTSPLSLFAALLWPAIVKIAYRLHEWRIHFRHPFAELRVRTLVGDAITREARDYLVWQTTLLFVVLLTALGATVYRDHLSHKAIEARLEGDLNRLRTLPTWKRPSGLREGPLGPIAAIEIVTIFRELPRPCLVTVTFDEGNREFGGTFRWLVHEVQGAGCDPADVDEMPRGLGSDSVAATGSAMNRVPIMVVRFRKGYSPGYELARKLFLLGYDVGTGSDMPPTSPTNLIWIQIGPGSPFRSDAR